MKEDTGKKPNIPQRNFITEQEFKKLVMAVPPRDIKYRIIMVCQMGLGLRASEVVAIRLTDVLWDNRKIWIRHAKTNHVVCKDIPEDVYFEMLDYCRHNLHTFVNGYLFPASCSSGNQHIIPCTYNKYLRKLCKRLHMDDLMPNGKHRITTHSFKKLGCTILYKKTKNLKLASEFAGHTDPRAIQHYIDSSVLVTQEKLDKIFRDTLPKKQYYL